MIFVVGICASIGVHPSAAASNEGRNVGFYLQGTCLCDATPTAEEALGLAGGYLKSAGSINGIGYPAGLLFAADAVVGSGAVNATLATVPNDTTVTLAGVSQGAIVLNYVKLSRLLQDSHGRPTSSLQFVTFGDPQNTTGGITTKNPALQLFAPNVPVPTSYPTTEIVREYDGFSDWPDKPNRLAVLNAVMGIGYVHPDYGTAADPTTPGTLKTVRTNAAGGTTTHYVVPTARLPLTQPLRDVGLNTGLLDSWLRPQVDAAYVRRPSVTAGHPTVPPPAEPAQAKDPAGTPGAKSAPAEPARDKTTDVPRPGTETSTAKPGTKASAAKDTTAAIGAKPTGSAKDK
ncbi:PE-PPE domain-containing protein [Mycobacterium sp. CBMA226]|nr:PE-PPE domain-containing protein [Mycolicibacterium sp. CBMA 226]